MATILERIQEKYPDRAADARNIAEALGMVYGTGGRGSGNIADVLYKNVTLTFDPNGGTGDAFNVQYPSGSTQMNIPECPFAPPEGKVFHYWHPEKAGTNNERGRWYPGMSDGGTNQNLTLYAIWKDAE